MYSLNKRPLSIIAAVLLAATGGLPAALARTWYVNVSAPGPAHDGTVPSTAWTSFASIDQALLSPGDVVLISSGSYNEQFTIQRSGSSASARITYRGVNTGAGMPTLYAISGGAFNYIAVLGIQFTQPNSSYQNIAAIKLQGATGWLIQDNNFYHTYGSPIDLHYHTSNNFNIIRCNLFNDIGYMPPGYTVGNDVVCVHGNFNLVEYNTFGLGWHRIYIYGLSNIVRNNRDTGTNSALFTQSAELGLNPEHIDDVHGDYSGGGVFYPAYVFMDRNWWSDAAGADTHNFLFQDYSVAGVAGGSGLLTNFVIRQNVCLRTGSAFMCAFQGTNYVRTYNNTVVGTGADWTGGSLYDSTVGFDSTYPSDNVSIQNNAFLDTNSYENVNIIYSGGSTNFTADYNAVYGNGVLTGFGTHNITANPLFTDTSTDTYTLQSGSPLIGAANAIATATGQASGSTSLVVSDATGFCDGFGIADGDLIVVGANPPVRISAVDYATNTITLFSPQTWSSGAAVFVKGTQDIGALPSSYPTSFTVANTTPITLVPGAALLTATVTNPDAVRKVEFLVDGIPQGASYSAPYSVSWTADGNAHVVEARAYSAWASKTPFLSSFNAAPIFNQQPSSQNPTAGASVVLTSNATAPAGISYTPTYQWNLNGVNLTDGTGISGSGTATLTLTNVSIANNGSYTVISTSPACGSTASNPAVIGVQAPAPAPTPAPASGPQAQTINFWSLPACTFGKPPISLSATASSGLAVTYTSSNHIVAQISGSTLTIEGAGTAVIKASQAGNSNYFPASATQTLTVALASQTISNFGSLPTITYKGSTIKWAVTLEAVASSGLHVGYSSSNPSVATTNGNSINVVGAGTAIITASQVGGDGYSPASANQTLTVINGG